MSGINPVIIATLLFMSCNGSKEPKPLQKIIPDTSKTFETEIPSIKSGRSEGQPSFLYTLISRDAKDLGLNNLERGYDSLEIRVWLGHSFASERHVVIIQRHKNKWLGKLVVFAIGYDTITKKALVEKIEQKVYPKSGWTAFVKTILSYNITTLPDEDDLTGYNGCGTDGLPYYFEIATEKMYRFYSYCNIEDNFKEFQEARYIDKIAKLLEEEFDFKFIK